MIKQIVNIEAIKLARQVFREFNRLDLSQVELYENGKPLPVTSDMIDEFKFCGLNNENFVDMRWWEPRKEIS